MRMALIEMVRELSRAQGYNLSQTQVLARVSEQLGIREPSPAKKAEQEALLTIWYDLFRDVADYCVPRSALRGTWRRGGRR